MAAKNFLDLILHSITVSSITLSNTIWILT